MNKKKKTILLSVLGVLLVIAIIVGTTYAFWKVTKVQEGEANTLTTTCLDVDLTSMSNGINLQTQFPITDEEGRKTEGYIFKISNKCNTYVSYDINLESLNTVVESNRLNLNNLVAIINNAEIRQLGNYKATVSALKTEAGTSYDTRVLRTDTIKPGSTSTPTSKEYTLRVWLDEDATEEAMNKEWNGKISISASPVMLYMDNSGAEIPELNNGLIPVTYNSKTGNWIKADISSKWYDYDEQWWANAVTVSSSSRSNYISAPANTPISMDDIETMWVWVPRYEYNITDMGESYGYAQKCSEIKNPTPEENPGCYSGFELINEDKWLEQLANYGDAITIATELKTNGYSNTVEATIEDMQFSIAWDNNIVLQYKAGEEFLPDNYDKSRLYPGEIRINFVDRDVKVASNNDYYIHPSFTFGNEDLPGMWVAKFEMSTGKTVCTPTHNSVDAECDLVTISPQIKPNVTSWRGARVGTMWTAVYNNMNGALNQYGFTNTDVHLMKNMEWGAVAYLSQSKYGKYGNPNYNKNEKEIYINNYAEYQTGCSAGSSADISSSTCEYTYNVEKQGTGASTTGNIYGIYDMSGGAEEYVMGVMREPSNLEPAVGSDDKFNSGWSGKISGGNKWISYTGVYGKLKDIESKYYDAYDYADYSNKNESQRYHPGDATYEVIGSLMVNDMSYAWFYDYNDFINYHSMFFVCGGDLWDFSSAGIFSHDNFSGYARTNLSARPTLVPLN